MCTGNICRSPMAAALLQRDLDRSQVDANVSSAGLLDLGAPASVEVVELMADRDLDVTGHTSRRMSPELLDAHDLVLAMAREHLREAVLLLPSRFPRTFTLKEIVRRGHQVGPRPAGRTLDDWLDLLAADRRLADFLGGSEDDDLEDPHGARFALFKRTATEIETLTGELVDLLWPRA